LTKQSVRDLIKGAPFKTLQARRKTRRENSYKALWLAHKAL